MQNNNQNEDNLFTQMFGLPSELPDNKNVSTQPPQPEPEEQKVVEQPQVVETPPKEEPLPEEKPTIENPLSSLNAPKEEVQTNQQPIESNQTITLTSNKKQDEEVFLSSNITSQEQAEKEMELSKSQEEQIQNTFAPSAQVNNNFTEPNPMSINNTYYQEVPQTYETPKKGFNSMPIVTILIILVIGGLVVGGTYIYKTYLQPSNNNLNNNPPNEEQEDEEQLDIIVEPEPEEEIKKVINFTENFSFNKGYTTNSNELNQKSPFKPIETTGVILCETLAAVKSPTEDIDQKLYFYYEENLLKKIIVHNHRNIKDNKTYQDVITSGKIIQNKFANQEGFRFTLKEYPGTKKIDTIMYMNLAYGNKVAFTEQKFYFELAYDYNDKIDTTLASLLYEESTLGKIACSSLITE